MGIDDLVRPVRITERLWQRVRDAGPDAELPVRIIVAWWTVRSYDGAIWTDCPAGRYLTEQLALHGYEAREDPLLVRTYRARLPPALIRTLATHRHIERLQLDPTVH